MTAFVDESYRLGASGAYVVAAVVFQREAAGPDPRSAARGLLLGGQRRLHWHDENEGRRSQLLGQLGRLDLVCRSYVCRLEAVRREPRARALCLNALLWDLWADDVDSLVIESRGDHEDRRDRSTIVAAQKSKRAAPTVDYRFERPSNEPMLWWADVVAGATAAALSGSRLLDRSSLQVRHSDVTP